MDPAQQPNAALFVASTNHVNTRPEPRQMEPQMYYPLVQHRGSLENSVEFESQEGFAQQDLSFSSLSMDAVSPNRSTGSILGRLRVDPFTGLSNYSLHPLDNNNTPSIPQTFHLQQRLRSLETENQLKDHEFQSIRCLAQTLECENRKLQDQYQLLQQRMWSDRQYFAQYARLFLDVQESGMRRELIKEEKEAWAELKLHRVSFLLHYQKVLNHQSESPSSIGLTISNTRTNTLSPSRPSKQRSDSLSASPRRQYQRPPHGSSCSPVISVRESSPVSSLNRTPDTSLQRSACQSSPLPQRVEDNSEMQQLLALISRQKNRIDELEATVVLLEKEKGGLSSDLNCERCLTVEMQEEIDDLITSELLLREEKLRCSIEQSCSDEYTSMLRNFYHNIYGHCGENSETKFLKYTVEKGASFGLADVVNEKVLSKLEVLQESVVSMNNMTQECFFNLLTKSDAIYHELRNRHRMGVQADSCYSLKGGSSPNDSRDILVSLAKDDCGIQKQFSQIMEHQFALSHLMSQLLNRSTNNTDSKMLSASSISS